MRMMGFFLRAVKHGGSGFYNTRDNTKERALAIASKNSLEKIEFQLDSFYDDILI